MPEVEWEKRVVEYRASIVEKARALGIENISVLKVYGRLVFVVPEGAENQQSLEGHIQTVLQSNTVGVVSTKARMFDPPEHSPNYPEHLIKAQRLLFSAIPLMELQADQPIERHQQTRRDRYAVEQEAKDRAHGVGMPSGTPSGTEKQPGSIGPLAGR